MTKLSYEQMENLQGGLSKDSATGLMCGMVIGFAVLAFPFSTIAAAPAIGCLVGALS